MNGFVAGYAPFDRAVPGKQPSPHQLKMLAAISPALAEDYAALIGLERLANPPFTIPHIGLDRKMEYGQTLLDPVQHRLWAISWAERTLPVIEATHPEYSAVARMGIDAARRVVRGTSGEDVRARAQAAIQGAIGQIEADHGYSEVTDPGYGALQCIDDVLYPMTTTYAASQSAINGAADALAWQPSDEEGPQHIANAAWVDIREEQLAELIAMLRLPPDEVGVRKLGVRKDPMATREQILALANRSKREALWHPNCPLDLWWGYAADYPAEALLTPLGALVLLESPNEWADFERKMARDWVRNQPTHLSPRGRLLFSISEAERVLPVWEAAYPEDYRPWNAIVKAKEFEAGLASEEEMLRAAKQAGTAGDAHRRAYNRFANQGDRPMPPGNFYEPAYAAWAANHAAGGGQYAAMHALRAEGIDSDEEAVPAWRRLREYLLAELPPESVGASQFSKTDIVEALRRNGYNQALAAAELHTSAQTVSRLVHRYEISFAESGLPEEPGLRGKEFRRRAREGRSDEEREAFSRKMADIAYGKWEAMTEEQRVIAIDRMTRARRVARGGTPNEDRALAIDLRVKALRRESDAMSEKDRRAALKKIDEVGRKDTYRLESAEARAKKYPKTFKIPSLAKRSALQPGSLAKVIFLPGQTNNPTNATGERMWVVVTRRRGKGYEGVLDSDPAVVTDLKAGAVIRFQPKHVADIHPQKLAAVKLAKYTAKVSGDDEDWATSFGSQGRGATDPILGQLIEQTRELLRLTEETEQIISSLSPYYSRREAVPDIETLYLGSHWSRFWELLGQLFATVHPHDYRYQEVATFYAKLFAMMGERMEYVRSETWYDRIYDAGNRYLEHLLGIGMALDGLIRREHTEEDLVLDFDPTAVNGSAGHHLRLLLQLFDSYGIAAGLTPAMLRFLTSEHRERSMSRKRR